MKTVSAAAKVLIVDDERVIHETLGAIFRHKGFDAKAVGSAEEALALIDAWAPDLAVLDVMLPGMSGVDLAVLLKARYPGCQILLFSGQPTSDVLVAEAAKAGHAFDLYPKPLHPMFLLDKAAQVRPALSSIEPEASDSN
jgi:DNA-binding NtrC family response regulator